MENIVITIIEKLDLNNEDMNVIAVTVVIGILLFGVYKSINSSFIEELFMSSKETEINRGYRYIFLALLLTAANSFLIVETFYLFIEVIISLIGAVGYFIYDRKANQVGKYKEIEELSLFYRERSQVFFLTVIISATPYSAESIYGYRSNISLYVYILIASVIETFFICMALPEVIKRESSAYYMEDDNKIYIYKELRDQIILCGDNPRVNRAQKYIFVNFDSLKDREIYNVQYSSLSKDRKKELIEMYKKLKSKNKPKSLMKQGMDNK